MGKQRKEDPPPAGAPAWMATFGDLMNLLLCFFVLLFSMSSVSEEKFVQVVASLNQSFNIFKGGAETIGEGMLISQGASQLNELAEFLNSTGLNEEGNPELTQFEQAVQDALEEEKSEEQKKQMDAAENLADQIAEGITKSGIGDEVDITYTAQYVRLTLNGEILFDSGEAVIKEEALPIVSQIGTVLERYADGTIQIEGHTDNVPMFGAKYSNNLELSQGRANALYQYLVADTALDPAKIVSAGRGEYIPVADNGTPEGRAKNRRVEIKIYHSLSTAY
jgi:chemotaxis protein MotB